MTTSQIIENIGRAGKSISVPTLYRLLSKLDIHPAGANQRPQIYPSDTASRIVAHLGLGKTATLELPARRIVLQSPELLPLRKIKSANGKAKN